MERQLCAGNRDDLGNLEGAGMWQPRGSRGAPAGASPPRRSLHCCRYGPRQHCSFHRPPAAPCLLFSMHEGYASRQTAPFVGCALQVPNGSPDHTASSLWLRPRSVSPAIPFASKAASVARTPRVCQFRRNAHPSMEFRPPFPAAQTYIHTPCNARNACNARVISGCNGYSGRNGWGRETCVTDGAAMAAPRRPVQRSRPHACAR